MSSNTEGKFTYPTEPGQSLPDGFLAFLDQNADGSYTPAGTKPSNPNRKIRRYFTGKKFRSARRNTSRRQIVILKTKRGGWGKDNIAYVLGLALELDGKEGEAPRSLYDVYILCDNYSLPLPTYIIETSDGHFHLIWLFQSPLPWTPKNARWWTALEQRLCHVFEDFGPDVNACLNPVQFYTNWAWINPYNFKRKNEISIHCTRNNTSAAAMQLALDRAGVPNPRISAETIIRQDLRERKYITETYEQWGERLGLSERTMKREIPKLIADGSLSEPAREGNNKPVKRTYLYNSNLYIEPAREDDTQLRDEMASPDFLQTSDVPIERLEAKGLTSALLTRSFLERGAREHYRSKTVYAVGKHFWAESRGKICAAELKKRLMPGFLRSDTDGTSGIFTEAELDHTINNIRKSKYPYPFSRKTLIAWGLVDPQTGLPQPHAVGASAPEVAH